jgi:hypothetical protein
VAFESLSDDELTDRWEASTLGGTGISHLDHVRIAWVLVQRYGREEAEERLVDGTRRNSETYGVAERFDEELTQRWAKAVADAVETNPGGGDFEAFLDANPELARGDLLGTPAWLRGARPD